MSSTTSSERFGLVQSMSDKVRDLHQYNQLKAKYVGLGNPDTTRKQFFTNIHRDSLALIIGHDPLLNHNSLVLNQHPEITRQQLLRKLVKPLGNENSDGK